MTMENFETTLLALLERRPFKPITIELNGGTRYEIDHPTRTAIYSPGEGKAAFLAPGGIAIFFDHESVKQIIDSPAHAAPRQKKKK